MNDHDDPPLESTERLTARLDGMLAAGRITLDEATRVREARDEAERRAAVTAIRTRHARDRVAAALAEGRLTAGEADDVLQRLSDGADPMTVRRLSAWQRRRRGEPSPPRVEPRGRQ